MDTEKNQLTNIEEKNTGVNLFDTNPDNVAKNMVTVATHTDVMTPEDKKFFVANTDRWQAVATNTEVFRTTKEKETILFEHPTAHSKFHQCILENKVYLDETVRLAESAEKEKLDAEGLYLDIEEIKQDIEDINNDLLSIKDEREKRKLEYRLKRTEIELRKKTVELQAKAYSIQNASITMKSRMDELKDWKRFEDELIDQMISQGYTEEQIWDKNFGQEEGFFFLFLNKYPAVHSSKDAGEIHNLTNLARYAVEQAIRNNKLESYLPRCTVEHIKSMEELGYIKVNIDTEGKIQNIEVINL